MADRFISFPEVYARRGTAKAILCEFSNRSLHWVPRSQISVRSAVQNEGDSGNLEVTLWWAETSGAIEAVGEAEPVVEMPRSSKIYRRLAAKYHPDHSPDTAEFMKDVNELWQAVKIDLASQR